MRGHPWRFAALAYVVVAATAVLVYRSTAAAQADAVVVLATVVETPGLTWAVEQATEAPRVEDVEVAGMPTTLVRPRGNGPWPVVVFMNGATRQGRDHPRVRALTQGLGRAGFLVIVADLPGLRESEVTTRTLDAALAVARAAAAREDALDGRIALFGVSVGAALALLVAEDPSLAERVSVVGAIAPYADLRNMVRLATTGRYSEGGRLVRFTTDPFLVRVASRSLVAEAPAGPARDTVARLLSNRDPGRFENLYAALPPEVHTDHVRLSPIARAARLRAPVEIASSPQDKYFPLAESRVLVARAPDARLTVTTTLDHAIPEPDDVPDLVRFDAFAVRVLERADG
jgi:pimeloyl-ACP methyl ester carboxylesterase